MNVELLKQVANKLRRMHHKEHFDMDVIIRKTDCGTAACIAGHALLMSGYKARLGGRYGTDVITPKGEIEDDPWEVAAKLLQLTSNQALLLFDASCWPEEFYGFGEEIYNDPKVAVARIEHFIATEGAE